MRVPSTCVVPENCLIGPTTVQTKSNSQMASKQSHGKRIWKILILSFSKSTKNQAYQIHWSSAGWQKFPERLPQDFETTHVHLLSRKNLLSRPGRRRWQGSLAWSLMFLSLCQFDFWSFWRWMIILFYWHRQCQSSTKAWNHCFYFLSCCTLCVKRRGHWVLQNTKAGYLNCKIKLATRS